MVWGLDAQYEYKTSTQGPKHPSPENRTLDLAGGSRGTSATAQDLSISGLAVSGMGGFGVLMVLLVGLTFTRLKKNTEVPNESKACALSAFQSDV